MPKQLSHADYMASTIHGALRLIRDRWTVKLIASMAGCSTSEVYSWFEEAADEPKGRFLFALAASLADRGDFVLIDILLPAGTRIATDEEEHHADGSTDDEVIALTIANAQIALAGQSRDADGLADGRRTLIELERRLEKEERLMRGRMAQSAQA